MQLTLLLSFLGCTRTTQTKKSPLEKKRTGVKNTHGSVNFQALHSSTVEATTKVPAASASAPAALFLSCPRKLQTPFLSSRKMWKMRKLGQLQLGRSSLLPVGPTAVSHDNLWGDGPSHRSPVLLTRDQEGTWQCHRVLPAASSQRDRGISCCSVYLAQGREEGK